MIAKTVVLLGLYINFLSNSRDLYIENIKLAEFYKLLRFKITVMKKKPNTALIFILVLGGIAGILYLLGLHETFGLAAMCLVALVLTFLIVFFISQ